MILSFKNYQMSILKKISFTKISTNLKQNHQSNVMNQNMNFISYREYLPVFFENTHYII